MNISSAHLVRLFACLLSACLIAACSNASGDPATSTSDPATEAASPAPSGSDDPAADFPELTSFSPELTEQLHHIRDSVSQIRGIPIHPTAQEGLVTREALGTYGRDQFAALEGQDALDAESGEAMLKLMGLIPSDYTFEEYAEEQANIIAGVFYSEADRLVLVGDDPGELSIADELTLAHEYAHSLQDARYDLEALSTKWTESDLEEQGYTSYSETLRCLIEGDAELAQRLYAEARYGLDWREAATADSAGDTEPPEFDIPEFILRGFMFYYSDCVAFVEQLYEEGGWDAVNAAYENPPGTTEQILDIEKYRSGELAAAPKPPGLEGLAGWSEVHGGQFGQYDVYNLLMCGTGDFFSSLLASLGWESGWLRLIRNDANPAEIAVEVRLSWDANVGTDPFVTAFEAALANDDIQPGDGSYPRRWTSTDGQQVHGALAQGEFAVRLVFASTEAAREAALMLP